MIKSTLNNNTTTTNTRKCHCIKCNTVLNTGEGLKVYSRKTNAFLCSYCARVMQGGYSTENGEIINQTTKTNDCTISLELEVSHSASRYNTEQQLQWLTNEAKFLKTPDGTVWYEFKSPIYNNLLGLSKVLHNFEKLNQLNRWNNATDYGTHLNIGNSLLTRQNLSIIERFYHSLFIDYCKHLEANPEKTTALHGRNFSQWATAINEFTNTQTHQNFINMQHSTHLEFRLCKLVTAKQYLMVARMYQDIVQKVICDYFLAKYNEAMPASDKRQLAKKASQKMIKLFEKYYSKLTNE